MDFFLDNGTGSNSKCNAMRTIALYGTLCPPLGRRATIIAPALPFPHGTEVRFRHSGDPGDRRGYAAIRAEESQPDRTKGRALPGGGLRRVKSNDVVTEG